jgi:ribosomal protein S6--L-glutamate ligase
VAAVDMLDLESGPKVFEVNSSPGIQEMELATGVDVARAIVERAAELAHQRPRKKNKKKRGAPSKA